MTDDDIKSYMKQFKVDRNTAIEEIREYLDAYYKKENDEMQKVYEDITKSSH